MYWTSLISMSRLGAWRTSDIESYQSAYVSLVLHRFSPNFFSKVTVHKLPLQLSTGFSHQLCDTISYFGPHLPLLLPYRNSRGSLRCYRIKHCVFGREFSCNMNISACPILPRPQRDIGRILRRPRQTSPLLYC